MTKRIIPNFQGRDELVTLSRRDSVSSDRYRMLFTKVDQICRTPQKKIIAFTSSIKGEGKTTTAANLAVVCGRDFGKRCLIIDGDYNHPALAKRFKMVNESGLVEVVDGKLQLGNALKKGPVENVAVLPMGRSLKGGDNVWTSGKVPELLNEVRSWFDYIWVDGPPILPLFDMSLISQAVDGVILVVGAGEVPQQALSQAIKSLGAEKVIGSVLNRAKMDWPSKYYEYGY